MTFQWIMLAQEGINLGDVMSPWRSLTPEMRDRLILFGVFTALILGLLFWAAFIRKARTKRTRITRPPNWEVDPEERSDRHRHRHRRRRRGSGGHPPNPTLAQTGGLPPVRSRDSSGSAGPKD